MRTIDDPTILTGLVTRFGALAPGSARAWGSINAQQMVSHLGDASAAVLKQRPFAAKPRTPNALRKFVVLRLLPRFPRGVKSGAEPGQKVLETSAFTADVERAVTLLQALAAASADALADRHPIFGEMSRKEWLRWAYLHTDHHLRQFGV